MSPVSRIACPVLADTRFSAVNVAEAAFIMQELGATEIKLKSNKVLCACIIHPDGAPSAAVLIHKHRGATFHCSACGHNQSLLGLIWRKMRTDGRPYTVALAAYWDAVFEDEKAARSPTRLDYRPEAPRAVHRDEQSDPVRPVISSLRGTQLDIMGRSQAEKNVKAFAEEDFQRYHDTPPSYMVVERGFDLPTLAAWEIRDNPKQYRAVFPVRDWDGKIYGITRRLYWKHDYCFRCKSDLKKPDDPTKLVYQCLKCGARYAKYLHSQGFHRNEILYGEYLYRSGAIPVIVEGTTDAMRLWQYGVRPPLASPFATLGACPGFEQVERLFDRVPLLPVIIVRDNDPPTEIHPNGPGAQMLQYFRRFADQIGDQRPIIEVTPWSKDAGGMAADEAAQLLEIVREVASGKRNSGRVTLAPDGPTWYGVDTESPHGAASTDPNEVSG